MYVHTQINFIVQKKRRIHFRHSCQMYSYSQVSVAYFLIADDSHSRLYLMAYRMITIISRWLNCISPSFVDEYYRSCVGVIGLTGAQC